MRTFNRLSRRPMRGVTLVECLIGLGALILILAGVGFFAGPGCSDIIYPRDVKGTVVKVDSRISSAKGGANEKFAVQLKDVTEADSTVRRAAGAKDGLMLECLSTRCALLEPGDCVELECNHVVNWWEPNTVECKLLKVVECKGSPTSAVPSSTAQTQ